MNIFGTRVPTMNGVVEHPDPASTRSRNLYESSLWLQLSCFAQRIPVFIGTIRGVPSWIPTCSAKSFGSPGCRAAVEAQSDFRHDVSLASRRS